MSINSKMFVVRYALKVKGIHTATQQKYEAFPSKILMLFRYEKIESIKHYNFMEQKYNNQIRIRELGLPRQKRFLGNLESFAMKAL